MGLADWLSQRAMESPGNHVLNDDAAWKIIARELKIPSDLFFSHLDLSAWNDIPNHEPTTTHFYRSKIEKGATMSTIVPELVEGFPTFPAADIAIGSLQGDYPQQAVLDWLGKISIGGHRDNADGELGLSNDTRMRRLTFFQDETEIEIQVPRGEVMVGLISKETPIHIHIRLELLC